jgi:hypothetical protein
MLVLNLTKTARNNNKFIILAIVVSTVVFFTGCFSAKVPKDTAVTPPFETATKQQLIDDANQFSKVSSMRAKMTLGFEDMSAANIGKSDKYQNAPGELIVQRPSNIYLKIEAPVVKVDIAQMTSNGKNFRVAVLEDGGSGKNKKFLVGSNDADYSPLQRIVPTSGTGDSDQEKLFQKGVSAFSNLRPQHFTEALLIQPLHADSDEYYYVQSEQYIEEGDATSKKSSPVARINNNYYLLEELKKKGGDLVLTRRFWFNRINKISLARQQIFAEDGTIDSDINYGNTGKFTATGEYELPLRIIVVRPKEKYKMTLTYNKPEEVIIGKDWAAKIFTLENRWDLPEVDLDKKLDNMKKGGAATASDEQH